MEQFTAYQAAMGDQFAAFQSSLQAKMQELDTKTGQAHEAATRALTMAERVLTESTTQGREMKNQIQELQREAAASAEKAKGTENMLEGYSLQAALAVEKATQLEQQAASDNANRVKQRLNDMKSLQ